MEQDKFKPVKFAKRIKVPKDKFGSDFLELGGLKIISVAFKVDEGNEKKVFCTRAYPNSDLTSWDMEFYNADTTDLNVTVEGVTVR
ncbi:MULTISPECIES: hypothetical protein [Bacillus cereus group]|uniref:hypothetical protein n=1 Tax=Bacillus cereus group TaxID=86661 RepID=UPI0005393F62|nr:hypothetical protein [Bacillus cereus]MRB98142.1 hypothetical protein [Bacillus thuringiensis]